MCILPTTARKVSLSWRSREGLTVCPARIDAAMSAAVAASSFTSSQTGQFSSAAADFSFITASMLSALVSKNCAAHSKSTGPI